MNKITAGFFVIYFCKDDDVYMQKFDKHGMPVGDSVGYSIWGRKKHTTNDLEDILLFDFRD